MKKILMIAGALWLSVQTQAQEVNKTFTGISKIKMNTASGSCRIVKGTGSEVNVKLTYTYDKDTYKPVLEQEGTTLILKEEFEGRNNSGSSKWTLTLPDNIDLNFNTGSGDLDVSDVAITMKSNTGSGNIDLQKIRGNVKINTGSGNITLQSIKGDIDGNTGSGSIDITSSEGDVAVNAGSGNIRLSGANGKIHANVGSGNIKATDLTLGGKGSFNSGSGDVSITLQSALQYDVSINSGSGDAKLNYNGNKMEGTVVMTANKDNGEILAPFKFDKTEELDEGRNARIRKTARLSDKDIEVRVSTGSGTAAIEK